MSGAPVRFDDSLPRLVEVLIAELGSMHVTGGVVLRDAVGRLSFVSRTALEEHQVQRVEAVLRTALEVYASPDQVLISPTEFGAESMLDDPEAMPCEVQGHLIQIVDRRIVGVDWLRRPALRAAGPLRVVFASSKGGVGRSTALSVMAAHLAGRGQRVLAIDLDLESPGLGAFLLTPETMPPFGMLDALVERNLTALDDDFYRDLIGPSSLATRGGRIDVVPGFGARSLAHPGDVLSKIARAFTEHVPPEGNVETVLDKVRAVIDHLAGLTTYDVVLVDARAGLHESTAASLLGLGAEVLLFASDEQQSFDGYAALLSHLSRFVPAGTTTIPEWVDRLTVVHAKAEVDASRRQGFTERWQTMVDQHGPVRAEVSSDEVPLPAGFDDVPWNDDADDAEVLPRERALADVRVVLRDDRFAGFSPLVRRDQVAEEIYRGAFGNLIEWFESSLFPQSET